MGKRDLQTFEDNSRKGRIDARHQPINALYSCRVAPQKGGAGSPEKSQKRRAAARGVPTVSGGSGLRLAFNQRRRFVRKRRDCRHRPPRWQPILQARLQPWVCVAQRKGRTARPKWSFSFSSGAGRSGHAFEHGRPTTPERRPASLVPHDQAGRRLGAGAGSLGAEL